MRGKPSPWNDQGRYRSQTREKITIDMQVDNSADAYLDTQQARAPDEMKQWWNDLSKAYDRK